MIEFSDIKIWGRSLYEYKKMFLLNEKDFNNKNIISFADGVSSFNSEASLLYETANILSVDVIYNKSKKELKLTYYESYRSIINQIKNNISSYNWNEYKNLHDLKIERLRIFKCFLEDYLKNNQRYQYGNILNFKTNKKIDLCLISHFLFLYSPIIDYSFHKRAILNLLSFSKEVRIFPIIKNNTEIYDAITQLRYDLKINGVKSEIFNSKYEFLKNANKFISFYKK